MTAIRRISASSSCVPPSPRSLSLSCRAVVDQSGSDRGQLGVQAGDLQRLLLAVRSQGQGADPVAAPGCPIPRSCTSAGPSRSRCPAISSGASRSASRIWSKHTDKLVRGLILCSPCNPTGAVYTAAGVQGDRRRGPRSNGIWIIADEIYRRISYGNGPAAVVPRPAG